jgi:hypothetical protein
VPSTRVSFLSCIFLGITCEITLLASIASAQQIPASSISTADSLQRMATAFSGGRVVSGVHLSGQANWHAGGLEDSGPVSLGATIDSSSTMVLTLSAVGTRTETQTGVGKDAVCQWSGADGITHEIHSGSCLTPSTWFLPTFFLQPGLISNQFQILDYGVEPVGSVPAPLLHLQSKLLSSASGGDEGAEMSQLGIADLWLAPATYLPAVFSYTVHPDNGAPTPIAIEIHYSDYHSANGVQIPFHIERYVNGALQLDIIIDSAETN